MQSRSGKDQKRGVIVFVSLYVLIRLMHAKTIIQVWRDYKRVYHGNVDALVNGAWLITDELKCVRVVDIDSDRDEIVVKVGY